MRNEFVSRRGTGSWSRNQNTVRHSQRSLGDMSTRIILGVMVLIIGLIYATQSVKATQFDYEISDIDTEISNLESRKEDLAVEKARLTSIAASENSAVAANMPEGQVAGYAKD